MYMYVYIRLKLASSHPSFPCTVWQGVSLISPRAESDPAAFAQAEAAIRRVHDPGYVEVRKL